jgi:osmotically inducible lipoprotein OsmB
MKKTLLASIAVILVVSFATGCTQNQRQTAGTVTGAVAGGVIGSELTGGSTAGTIAGAVGGGYVGHELTN